MSKKVYFLLALLICVCGPMVTIVPDIIGARGEAPITPGTTVTDPGADSWRTSEILPMNLHEIQAESVVKALGVCFRVTGAKMIALEQVDEEVLVRYSNSEKEKTRLDCPTGVVFWISASSFRKADSEYQEVLRQDQALEEARRAKEQKELRKTEAVRRHVTPAPPVVVPDPPKADRPRRGPSAPRPSRR
ncbi:MAG: hypothetical protein UW79_C0013G0024 [Candidatus Yanofskybacteria bacterium GW2011_GWA2_44_9]|nr:MAG: hypothetical protein UW79_C0013G0024 [Candidatus Yanofskybacteria bacterium GW2011_GWA2_44_9]